MRRLLPRHPREVGKRGQVLILLGIIWISLGAGLVIAGEPPHYAQIKLFTWVPLDLRIVGWVGSGSIALACAWRPRIFHDDQIGYLALYVMPAWRCVAYLYGWLDSWLPLGGGAGYPRGWISAAVWGAITGLIIILSDWPDPIKVRR